jgi:predicted RNase H-related nuclease YkuK (DUF458 family)
MPLPYDDIIEDIRQFCEKTLEKYKILGGFSPNLDDKGKDVIHVVLSFIHDDFYKKPNTATNQKGQGQC